MPLDFSVYDGMGSPLLDGPEPGFTRDIPPEDLLRDRRVINRVRDYYRMKGKTFEDDEDMMSSWITGMRAESANTVGAYMANREAREADEEGKAVIRDLLDVWERLPNFWEEGGTGNPMGAVGTYLAAGVFDPVNLIPIPGAGKAAGLAASQALKQGAKGATRAGAWAAAKRGAKWEAGVNALAEGVIAGQEESRDVELGRKELTDPLNVLSRAAMGGAVGGLAGGAIGGVAGAAQVPRQVLGRQAEELEKLGAKGVPQPGILESAKTALIPGKQHDLADAVMRSQEGKIEDLAKRQAESLAPEAPTTVASRGAPAPAQDEPELTPVQAATRRYERASAELKRAERDGLDPDYLQVQRTYTNRLRAYSDTLSELGDVDDQIMALREVAGKPNTDAAIARLSGQRDELRDIARAFDEDPNSDVAIRLGEYRKKRSAAGVPPDAIQKPPVQEAPPQAKAPEQPVAGQPPVAPGPQAGVAEPAQAAKGPVGAPGPQAGQQAAPGAPGAALAPEPPPTPEAPPPDPVALSRRFKDKSAQAFVRARAKQYPGYARYLSDLGEDVPEDSTLRAVKDDFEAWMEMDGNRSPTEEPEIQAVAEAEAEAVVPPVVRPEPAPEDAWASVEVSFSKQGGDVTQQYFDANKGLLRPEDVPNLLGNGGKYVDRGKLRRLVETRKQLQADQEAIRADKVKTEAERRKTRMSGAADGKKKSVAVEKDVNRIIEEDEDYISNGNDAETRILSAATSKEFQSLLSDFSGMEEQELILAIGSGMRSFVSGSVDIAEEVLSRVHDGLLKKIHGRYTSDDMAKVSRLSDYFEGLGDSPDVASFKATIRVFEERAKASGSAVPEAKKPPMPKGEPDEHGRYEDGAFESLDAARAYAENTVIRVKVGEEKGGYWEKIKIPGVGTRNVWRKTTRIIEDKGRMLDPLAFVAKEDVTVKVPKDGKLTGVVTLKAGDTGWYDPITRKVFGNFDEMMVARDGRGFSGPIPVYRADPAESAKFHSEQIMEATNVVNGLRSKLAEAEHTTESLLDRFGENSTAYLTADREASELARKVSAAEAKLRALTQGAPATAAAEGNQKGTGISAQEWIEIFQRHGFRAANERLRADLWGNRKAAEATKPPVAPAPAKPAADKPATPEERLARVKALNISVPPGRRLALMPKSGDPEQMRILRDSQVGGGAEALLGKSGDPDLYVAGHVPEELADDKINAFAEFRPGEATKAKAPQKRTISFEDAKTTELSEDQIARAMRLGVLRKVKPGETPTVASLHDSLTYLESVVTTEKLKDAKTAAEFIDGLEAGWRIVAEVAPDGVALPKSDKSAAIEQVKKIFAGSDPKIIAEAIRLIESLAGGEAPILLKGSASARGMQVDGRFRDAVDVNQPNTVLIADAGLHREPFAGQVGKLQTLYHEVAHWAYRNILSSDDRADFWAWYRKSMYDPKTGALDESKFSQFLPPMHDPAYTGKTKVPTYSGRSGPGELFAEQFVAYMMKRGEASGDPSFWGRMVGVIRDVFNWFFEGNPVAPELEPLFAKIVPDDIEGLRAAAGGSTPVSALSKQGQVVRTRASELDHLEDTFVRAWLADDPGSMVEQSKQMLSHLYSVAPKLFGVNQEKKTLGALQSVRKQINKFRDDLAASFKEAGVQVIPRGTPDAGFGELSDAAVSRLAILSDVLDGNIADEAGYREAIAQMGLPRDMLLKIKDARKGGALRAQLLEDASAYYDDLYPASGDELPGVAFAMEGAAEGDAVARIENTEALDGVLRQFFEANDAPSLFEMMRAMYRQALIDTDGLAGLKVAEVPQSVRGARKLTVEEMQAHRQRYKRPPNYLRNREEILAQAGIDASARPAGPRAKKDNAGLHSTTLDELLDKYRRSAAGGEKTQIAAVILEKRKAELPFDPKKAPKLDQKRRQEIKAMRSGDMARKAAEALDAGDDALARAIIWESQFRGAKKQASEGGITLERPKGFFTDRLSASIAYELRDRVGPEVEPGIPGNATTGVKWALRGISNRDPELERVQRTLAYRLLSLNKSNRETNVLLADDLARLIGSDPEPGAGVIQAYNDPIFGQFRSQMRRLSASINVPGKDGHEAVENLGRIILRTRIFDQDRQTIEQLANVFYSNDTFYLPHNNMGSEEVVANVWAKTVSNRPQIDENIHAFTQIPEELSLRLDDAGISGANTVNDVFHAMANAELVQWRSIDTYDKFKKVMATRAAIKDVAEQVAPAGFKLNSVDIETSLGQVGTLLGKYDSKIINAGLELIESIVAPQDAMPPVTVGDTGNAYAHVRVKMGGGDAKRNAVVFNRNRKLQDLGDEGRDTLDVLMHELGHWAYFNLLTSRDRDDFWKFIGDNFYADGKLEIQKYLITPKASESWIADQVDELPAGSRLKGQTNGADSPQEMFAELFNQYLASRSVGVMQDIGRYDATAKHIRSLIAWYTDPGIIPDELSEILSKIVKVGDQTIADPVGEAQRKYGLSKKAALSFDTLQDNSLVRMGNELFDSMTDAAAYALNGQVGNRLLKDTHLRLFLYGDLIDGGKKPASELMAPDGTIRARESALYEADLAQSMPQARRDHVQRWTVGGLGQHEDGSPRVLYQYPDGHVRLRPDSGISGNPKLKTRAAQELYDLHEATERASYQAEMEARALRVRYYRDGQAAHLEKARSVESSIESLRKVLDTYEDKLESAGAELGTRVRPVFVKARNPLDLSDDRWIETGTLEGEDEILRLIGAVEYHLDEVATSENGFDFETIASFYAYGSSSTHARGSDIMDGLIRAAAEYSGVGFDDAENLVKEALFKAGHDAIIRKDSMVDFQSSSAQVKPALEFIDSPDYAEPVAKNPGSGRLAGSVVQSMAMADEEDGFKGVMLSVLDSVPEHDRPVADMLSAVSTGRVLAEEDLQALRRASRSTQVFGSNSKRMRQYGLSWFGDYVETAIPKTHQLFGSWWAPVHDALAKLEPRDSTQIGRAFRKWKKGILSPWQADNQPDSHHKIMWALRYAPGTKQFEARYARMSADERGVYTELRKTFDKILLDLQDTGNIVGTVKNYFPQVWDVNTISAHPGAFKRIISKYLKNEWARAGVMREDPDAESVAVASDILARLIRDDGVYIPDGARGTGGYARANSLDYSRLINLQHDPEVMAEIEALSRENVPLLSNSLEGVLVRYMDQAARRVVEARTLGARAFAFHDYTRVVFEGPEAAVELLSSPKVFRMQKHITDGEGHIATAQDELEIHVPFFNRSSEARKFVRELVETYLSSPNANRSGAKQALMDMMPKTVTSKQQVAAYERRMDALVNGLADSAGGTLQTHKEGYKDAYGTLLSIQGRLNHNSKEWAKKLSRGVRTFNSVTLLDMAMLSSMGDMILPLIRSGDMKSYIKAVSRFAQDPDYRRQIRNTGVAWESLLHSRMTGLYAGDVGGVSGKISQSFFQANLLTPWTDLWRKLAAATGLEALDAQANIAARHWRPGAAPAQQAPEWKRAHRILSAYGLGDMSSNFSGRLDPEKDPRVAEAMIRFANDAIFSPGPAETPLWAQTPFGAMVWQLKAFPIMMQRMALGTDERGGVLTNAMRAGRHWLASNSETFKHVAKPGDDAYTARDAIPAAMLLTIGPLGGALALSAKDVVQQRAEDDEWVRTRNAAKTPIGQFVGLPESDASDLYGWYWESAMMVGGLGFLAELMQDLVAQQDNGYFGVSRILSTVLGPWVSLGVDGYVTFQGLSEGARQAAGFSDGSGVGQERAAIRNVVNRIPGLGSNFAAREGIVNAIQPEAPKGNGGGGGGGVDRSAWNAGFDTQWGSDW